MSKLIAEYLQHPLSASANIALLDDGNVGGVLGATLGSKLDVSAYEQPGLELITSESFSAVSSVSVDGCFTSDYANYKILITIPSGGASIALRLRASGSDDSSAVYDLAGSYVGTTSGNIISVAQNFYQNYVGGYAINDAELLIIGPQLSAATRFIGVVLQTSNDGTNVYRINNTCCFRNSTSFDGFSIFPGGSGTYTGTLRVYGYKD